MPNNKPNAVLDAALQHAARGWKLFPLAAGAKVPKKGSHGCLDATSDPEKIREWFTGKPHLNVGLATGRGSGVFAFDIDGELGAASLMDLEQRYGELPPTLTQRTRSGSLQHLFQIPAGVTIPTNAGIIAPGIDLRGEGGYSAIPPSRTSDGGTYRWTTELDPAEPPQWLLELIAGGRAAPQPTAGDPMSLTAGDIADDNLATAPGFHKGQGRNHRLTQLVGISLKTGVPLNIIRDQARAFGARCVPPLPLKECDATTNNIAFRELEQLRDAAGVTDPAGAVSGVPADDYDPELEAITLRTPSWPARPHAILEHGVVGELLRRVEEETEADAVSIASTFLVALGNVIGRGPHAVVDGTRHGPNLFAVIVGGTSEGRKGTSMGVIRAIMRDVDPDWVRWCRTPNLVSGEGLIDRVRDDVYRLVVNKKTGEPENVLVEPGVEDKRLLCEIQELAGTMRAGRSERSTLFQTMREAWDGSDLATMSKNSRRSATEPHISITAHITPEELSNLQTDADIYGGSWNRFLWIASKRARLRPHGGDFDDLTELQASVRSVVTHAQNVGRMRRTPAADRLWETEYLRRAEVRAGGVVGAIIGRADSQLLRLSMLAALCRKEPVVDVEDLAAALSLWQYVDETVRMLFAGCEDPVVARIIGAIRAEPGISRSALHRQTAKGMPAARFVQMLERAAATGAVEAEQTETAGRPREVWRPRDIRRVVERTAREEGRKGGKPFSPLSPLSPDNRAPQLPGSPSRSSKHGRTL
jgi:hypothetical protein